MPSNSVCGVIEPGLTTTWPRSTSSRLVPRSSRPTFSPARASSSCLRNISMPVTVVFVDVSLMPTISTSALILRMPRSTRPVTTVPRPVIVKTSSTGMRNGLSMSRTGSRDGLVDGLHELEDLAGPLGVALERLEAGDAHDRQRCRRRTPGGEQLAHLELDELQDLLVVDHVGLVQRDDDVGHADLAGEQHVLTRLRHRAVGGGDHEDRAVHLGGTGDHVLDVVGVTRGVDVRVVALRRLVLDVRDVDRDAALALFGSVVDLVEGVLPGSARVLVVQHLRDRSGQRGLTVVDVTDGSDVDVRLGPLELGLATGSSSGLVSVDAVRPCWTCDRCSGDWL